MKVKYWFSIIFLLLAVLVISSPALAQDPTRLPTDDEVNAIAKQLYCPVCENTPLDVCPTQACAEWRNLIRDKLAQGWSAQQIKDYFVEQYGDRVLASPPARGLNWLVYVIPPLAFLAGVYILYRAFRVWRGTPAQAEVIAVPQINSDDEYVERLEEELRKM